MSIYSSRLLLFVSLVLFIIPINIACSAILLKTNCKDNEQEHICIARGGIEYIYFYDEIDTPTYDRFMYVASEVPLNKSFPKVYLNSHGGSPIYARQMGRILRLRSAVVEGRDMISPEREPRCASACVELAAGGTTRNFVQLQVHKGYIISRIKGEEYDYKPMPEEEMIETKNYFSEMGISSEVVDLINSTSPDKEWIHIRYDAKKPFKEQEIYRLGFLMDEKTAEELEKLHWDGEQDD